MSTLLTALAAAGFYVLVAGSGIRPRLAGAVCFAVLAPLAALVVRTGFRPSMVPYFEHPVGDIGTFGKGVSLARCSRRLDELAQDLSVRSLSSFGFADDLRGETVQWHDPARGLATAEALLASPALRGESFAALRSDLETLADALRKAARTNARFALIVRSGGTNALEHELREGSFF